MSIAYEAIIIHHDVGQRRDDALLFPFSQSGTVEGEATTMFPVPQVRDRRGEAITTATPESAMTTRCFRLRQSGTARG